MPRITTLRYTKEGIFVLPENTPDSSRELSCGELKPHFLSYTDVNHAHNLGITQWCELYVIVDEEQRAITLRGAPSDQHMLIYYQDSAFTDDELELLAILAGIQGRYCWDGELGVDFFTISEEEALHNRQNIQNVSWIFSALFPELDGDAVVNDECITCTAFNIELHKKVYQYDKGVNGNSVHALSCAPKTMFHVPD